jgi:thiamine-phosphate pyrophosphorylase
VYAIVDDSAARPPLDLVAAFVRGGAAVVQLRLKRAGAGELVRAAREARKICSGRALLLVNDRPDVARLAEADGVHLGQEDLPWQEARAIVGPDALVGVSTHGDEEIDGAQGADYIGFGPIFATASKPGAPLPPPHGAAGLARAVRRSPVPIVAIGGIGEETAGEVARAGARCAAAIAALCSAADPESAVARLRAAFEAGAR